MIDARIRRREKQLNQAISLIDTMAGKGIIHRNTASRYISPAERPAIQKPHNGSRGSGSGWCGGKAARRNVAVRSNVAAIVIGHVGVGPNAAGTLVGENPGQLGEVLPGAHFGNDPR